MTVPEIMNSDSLDAAELDSSGHFFFQKCLWYRQQTVCWLRIVKAVLVVLDIFSKKRRNIDHSVALRRLWLGNDIFAFKALIGLVDSDHLRFQIYIFKCQCQ